MIVETDNWFPENGTDFLELAETSVKLCGPYLHHDTGISNF